MLITLVLGCLLMFSTWKALNGHNLARIVMMLLVSPLILLFVSSYVISFPESYCQIFKVRTCVSSYMIFIMLNLMFRLESFLI
jgi:hypothetical protein